MRNNNKKYYTNKKRKKQVNVAERFMMIAKDYLPLEVYGSIYQSCFETPQPKLNK